MNISIRSHYTSIANAAVAAQNAGSNRFWVGFHVGQIREHALALNLREAKHGKSELYQKRYAKMMWAVSDAVDSCTLDKPCAAEKLSSVIKFAKMTRELHEIND